MPIGVNRSEDYGTSSRGWKQVVLADSAAIATGATSNFDLSTEGYVSLRVFYLLTGSVTSATDLSKAVRAYYPDDATLVNLQITGLPTVTSVPLALSGVSTAGVDDYDLRGVTKVQVRAVNSNAAGQTLTIVAYLLR